MFGIGNSNLKKSILQEIYVDNLLVAGKSVKAEPPSEPSADRKSLKVLLIFMALGLASFSGLATSLTQDEHLIKAEQPVVVEKKKDSTASTIATAKPDPIEPDPIEPDPIEPDPIEPGQIESDLIKPGQVEPDQIEPDPIEPVPVESLMAEWDHLSVKMPSWLATHTKKRKLYDYSLLIPKNDVTRVSSLFGLGIKTIVIDPGHGGKDPGAIGANGTKEKYITLDVALRLKQRIVELNQFDVLLTRKTDKFLTLAARVDFARQNGADLFISIHVNSLPNETVNLIETYYFGPPLNSETFKLAQKENQDSHFSVSELEGIIQDIGNTVKRQESQILAGAIQYSLYKHLKNQDPEVINSGVKMAPFVVLSQIEVPSVLVEISCITNENEEAKLKQSKYREKIASYIDEGIVAYLNLNYFKTINGEKQNE